MNTNHTPGPWRCDYNAAGDWEIHATTEQSEFSFWIATVHAEAPKEQTEANARLIAAAPDLLEALRDIHKEATKKTSTLADMDAFTAAIERAGNTIAKATQS